MNGRVEVDMNIFSKIEKQIIGYPDYIISWYYYLKANQQSAMSCRDYINKITKFLRFINKDINLVTLNDLKEDVIVRYFIEIQNRDNKTETSVSYRQCVWSCLNNFFNFLYKRKLVQYNIFETSGIERPKGNDLERINKNRKLLTKDDFKNILSKIDEGVGTNKAKGYQRYYKNRDKAIFLIFMSTGIRKTALEEINIQDVDMEKHCLHTIDKGHVAHSYYLNDEVLDAINNWMIDRNFILNDVKNDALFISKERKRMHGNTIAKLVDKYSYEALGYHISPHKLRSGFASIMYEQTGDIEFVRRVIGHSQVSTTQRYIVTDNSEREEAANIMNKLLA